MWVSLLIPKIEDGNNFGVSVQEDTLAEIQQVEVEATNYLEQVSRYYVTRAKLITKVCINLNISIILLKVNLLYMPYKKNLYFLTT